MDYGDKSGGLYRGFYILSPNFDPKGPVVFILTDGQMELVGPRPDFAFFDEQLPGMSYVLIGHRGHSPTLFPEVYSNGKLDLGRATTLYGSWQRVEDIERVRQDMVAAKLLPSDGRILIFGASGAGVLAQQYLDRYGEHVSRALLVSTGAPDLARQHGWTYARNLAEMDPETGRLLSKMTALEKGHHADLAYMLFQLGREGAAGMKKVREVVRAELNHNPLPYAWYELHPSLNWPLSRALLDQPAATAAKVRMYELLGPDLQASKSYGYDLPLYLWSREILANFLDRRAPLPDLRLDRSRYQGEVLVIAGKDDIVFSPAIGRAIASAYPKGRYLLVRGGHRLELDRGYQHALRRAFLRHGLRSADTSSLLRSAPALPVR
uniref:alpha/beta fold hydrolase n=1 Tax=Altererythrobacter segetis TaxID=1104773 RepID=UPI00140E3A9E|nr:hypothetical protein [Altererythrobacter segetis]